VNNSVGNSPHQPDQNINPPATKVLSGWKEISTYLRSGVRTAQRWETIGLPVRRIGVGQIRPVFAFAEELDAWEKAAPTHFLDVIADLKAKIYSLEVELTSLKQQLADQRRWSWEKPWVGVQLTPELKRSGYSSITRKKLDASRSSSKTPRQREPKSLSCDGLPMADALF
jgi:hypothetical protein